MSGDDDEQNVLAALLDHAEYSFDPIGWDHNKLTPAEQEILSPGDLRAIQLFCAERKEE